MERTSDVNDAGVGALRWGFADLEAYCMIGRGLFLPARLHVSIAIFSCVVACEPELFPGARRRGMPVNGWLRVALL